MNLVLARVDDRLIHGQVVLGCCGPTQARRIILCDDEVAGDALQSRIYAAAVPPEIEVEILDRVATARRLTQLQADDDAAATLLVAGRPAVMLQLLAAGVALMRVNVGGLHHREGAKERWPGFYLDDTDESALRELARRGVRIEVQTVPGAPCLDATAELESS